MTLRADISCAMLLISGILCDAVIRRTTVYSGTRVTLTRVGQLYRVVMCWGGAAGVVKVPP